MADKKNYIKIVLGSLLISAIGVFVIDYFSHLLFSDPMETPAYFMAKMAFYFIFSLIFLSVFDLKGNTFITVASAGVIISSIFGFYYNILPAIFYYQPFGIPLRGLTFLGMGLVGTGLAFGVVHALAFIVGYYSAKFLLKKL
ncbi:hypothetical protein HY839_02735 [Candidatus Azambacteria bacterium]|nr:hypothetical protein [Candidatus Azambacteria bacterium]